MVFILLAEDGIPAKLLSYNRANRAVAVLCNHQRAAPKNFEKQMENIQVKVEWKFYYILSDKSFVFSWCSFLEALAF